MRFAISAWQSASLSDGSPEQVDGEGVVTTLTLLNVEGAADVPFRIDTVIVAVLERLTTQEPFDDDEHPVHEAT